MYIATLPFKYVIFLIYTAMYIRLQNTTATFIYKKIMFFHQISTCKYM